MKLTKGFLNREPRKTVLSFVVSLTLMVLAAIMSGCNDNPGVPVTGAEKAADDEQSETASACAFYKGENIVVVTYNDGTDHDPTVTYGPNSRKVIAGASLMGWSYSKNKGQSWTYGGKVSPPNGWAVLWGDPAITDDNGAYQYVFMSNLAIPNSKMPANGIDGSVIVSGADSYIGGACIARSADGGVTFQNYQCVSNTVKNSVPNSDKGHFYDGGSMASSNAGEIFAAFVDVTTSQIDVWRSPSASGQFAMLPPPFPGIGICSHPRLRVRRADGALYVAAQACNNSVAFINRYINGSWGQPVAATDSGVIYPNVAFGGGLTLRTGPQFSFDVGAASNENQSDAIRFLYTRRDSKTGRLFVTGSFCPASLSPGCWGAPEWGTTPGNLNTPGDQFNPNVAAWPGFIGIDPAWKSSFLDRDGSVQNAVTLRQGNLAYLPNGNRIYLPFIVLGDKPVCPDTRGYWGDYGDLALVGFENNIAQFLVTTSDSSLGCDRRWDFDSHNQHIRGVVFQ